MFSFEHRQLIESNYHPLIGTGRLLKKDHSSSQTCATGARSFRYELKQ